jgi:hypothetical protein
MKKIYLKPELDIILINTNEGMLTISAGNEYTEGDITYSRSDLFEDEEEDIF